MKIVLKNATIIAPHSAYHKQTTNIFIENGVITAIGEMPSAEGDTIIESENLHVSIGWLDVFTDFAEPGFEHNETLVTGANAAAAGGFTHVMQLPNTNPVVDNKAAVEFLIERSKSLPVSILPIGAISKQLDGNSLAEMYDMHQSGAVAFSDGRKPMQQSGVLLKALQYVSAKNATVIQMLNDKSLSDGGLMHEGIVSTQLGLPGIPAIAEELMLARDIELLQYSQSKLHVTGVSTKKSVELIADAKQRGLQISCSVTPYHLSFTDTDLEQYNTNFKVIPPLRLEEDVLALREALANGTIDCIASHHNPQCWDNKICEFEQADYGMAAIQSTYNVVQSLIADVEQVVGILTEKNRSIFSIPLPKIEIGAPACLTLFEPQASTCLTEAQMLSKSKNNAFIGKQLKGKVVATIFKNKLNLNN
jgi:dihydroorotase